jgi:hypothetical protein
LHQIQKEKVKMSKVLTAVPSTISGKAGDAPIQISVHDESSKDLTHTATYLSDKPAVATVTPRGLVSLKSPGSCSIKVTAADKSTSTSVSVSVS